uniref:glucose-fructose oxidoreductase domain-containing protein 2 n=1 Tax=Myxine glutinosa TaxID=7769 RepID=UPI00358EC0F5
MLPGIGVFGTGVTTRVLVPLLRAEGFRVEALWGRTQDEVEDLASEMQVPFFSIRIDDVLLNHRVDLVCIHIPPSLTRQIAVKSLGIGKNVVCEKPATSEDALEMVEAARYYPQLLSLMGNVLRMLPAFRRMRQLIQRGCVGAPAVCEARVHGASLLEQRYSWQCDELMGGGALHAFGGYIIDLITFLTGRRARRAHGLLLTLARQTTGVRGVRHVTSDDFCTFQLALDGGTCASVTLNFNVPGTSVHELMIVGSRGRLTARGADLYLHINGPSISISNRALQGDEDKYHDEDEDLQSQEEEQEGELYEDDMIEEQLNLQKNNSLKLNLEEDTPERIVYEDKDVRRQRVRVAAKDEEENSEDFQGQRKMFFDEQYERSQFSVRALGRTSPDGERLILRDSTKLPSFPSSSEAASSLIPEPYLRGLVHTVHELRAVFEAGVERRFCDHCPLESAATFEDGLYMLTVVEAIQRSSRLREWVNVEVPGKEPDDGDPGGRDV